MGSWLLLLLFFHSLPLTLAGGSQTATITVNASSTVAETDDNFVCATLDWWPPEKCNYDQCPWGMASVFNLDLQNPLLAKAIRAFNPLRIRIGGSLQDQLVYEEPSMGYPCRPFEKQADGMFGFSTGCLSRAKWDELNLLFMNTGVIVTFGLNALHGRHQTRSGVWAGPWNSSNARAFMEYTASKGYPVDSWELGNELSGSGVGARVNAGVYGKDLIKLKGTVKELYEGWSSQPLVLAPGGFFDHQWYMDLLRASGPGVADVITHHIYNLGAGNDPQVINRILDPQYLSRITSTFQDLRTLVQKDGPWASTWISESGGAYNSGGRLISDTFLDSFWYLDQMGMAAKHSTRCYCRQSLIGGNYGLLDLNTFIPNPDYYGALLWHRLMGRGVLEVNLTGSPFLRAYAHCTKNRGGLSLLFINLSNSTDFIVDGDGHLFSGVVRDSALMHGLKSAVAWIGREASEGGGAAAGGCREEYHLTGKDGRPRSKTVLLNGVPLELTAGGDIPAMDPLLVPRQSPIRIMPLSVAFVVFPYFHAPPCCA
ncbi:unnamed protein product [Spirodela intermedia]|uniref:Uncharacterized protein n=1 Tax=Spirodela intermedia TaxID=51605 RepID=A0A7I8LBX0_SPIIN|nr:unnamed protein product [Spirodela intermedia]